MALRLILGDAEALFFSFVVEAKRMDDARKRGTYVML